MPKDKTETHEKIIPAAIDEFLEYGFEKASMRRIGARIGITAAALYCHFDSKEAMFAALVQPVIDGLNEMYGSAQEQDFSEIGKIPPSELFNNNEEINMAMNYIYDNFDIFKLLVCRSQGTKYESFIHDIAMIEEKTSLRYIKELKKQGYSVKMPRSKEFHLLVTANVHAIFEPVIHDFTRKEAIRYAKTLDEFFAAGWKKILCL